MDTKKRSPIDRLLFATFLKGRTSSRDVWEEKGDMTPEDNQKIIEETNEIINDDSTYPFISYLSDLLAKSKPSDEKICYNQIRQNSSLQAISPQFSCGSARIKNKGPNFNCQNGGTIMAIFEKTIRNKNFDKLLRKLENEIPDSSWSADLEAGSDFKEGDARCSVRVFERYSMMGGNRLSLTLTMFQNGDSPIRLSAITAGGSQAVFFKVNTLGEESFLDDVKDLLEEILEE